jgi:hypothetical protein
MPEMRVYLLSLRAGFLVGIIYSLLKCDRWRRPWWRWSGCWASS